MCDYTTKVTFVKEKVGLADDERVEEIACWRSVNHLDYSSRLFVESLDMRKVGLFEAKQKLSELVDRASRGERIGITKRGKLAAMVVPAEQETVDLKEVFAAMDRIRKNAKPLRGVTVKDLITEGRK